MINTLLNSSIQTLLSQQPMNFQILLVDMLLDNIETDMETSDGNGEKLKMKNKVTIHNILKRNENIEKDLIKLTAEKADIVLAGDSDPIKPATLANWRVSKKYDLKYLKIGKNVRYRLSDCLEFLESKTFN